VISFREYLSESDDSFKAKSIQIALDQRGEPEDLMLKVQMLMGGGVLNPVVEHAGDIINRAFQRIMWDTHGYEYCKDKVNKVLKYLTDSYGFEREMEENISNNYDYRINRSENREKFLEKYPTENDFRRALYQRLKDYGKSHMALDSYNRAQYLCRHLCYCIGMRQWVFVINDLYELKEHLNSVEDWVKFCNEETE